jgi:hypothetical protein
VYPASSEVDVTKKRPLASPMPAPVSALPGLWRENGGLSGLVRLDIPAITPGMVVVAKRNEPWQTRPELRWQTWPDRLESDLSSTVSAQ